MYWIFLAAIAVQCWYGGYIFTRAFKPLVGAALPFSLRKRATIVICAKNEVENLERTLPSMLQQKYCDSNGVLMYDVTVVNDASTDGTAALLQQLATVHSHLNVVTISADEKRILKGKKHALSRGVSAAANSWLLLTDADCSPATDQWLELMVAPLAYQKTIVAGYGGYYTERGLLNAFARWETMHTFLQYSTYLLAGWPYMAVGRNMACTKQVLEQVQLHDIWNAIPSGDDDFLVNIAGTGENMALVADRRAFTYSPAKNSLADYIAQKQRHLSTGKYYRRGSKLMLGIYAGSHAVTWLGAAAMIWLGHWQIVAIFLTLRCGAYWLLWQTTAARLNEKKLFYLYPAFDIGWMLYNFAFLPYITWKNKKTWK